MKHIVKNRSLRSHSDFNSRLSCLKLLPVYISRITTSFYRLRAIQARTRFRQKRSDKIGSPSLRALNSRPRSRSPTCVSLKLVVSYEPYPTTRSSLSLTFDARDRNTLLPHINLGLLSPLLIHNGFFHVFAVASRNTSTLSLTCFVPCRDYPPGER